MPFHGPSTGYNYLSSNSRGPPPHLMLAQTYLPPTYPRSSAGPDRRGAPTDLCYRAMDYHPRDPRQRAMHHHRQEPHSTGRSTNHGRGPFAYHIEELMRQEDISREQYRRDAERRAMAEAAWHNEHLQNYHNEPHAAVALAHGPLNSSNRNGGSGTPAVGPRRRRDSNRHKETSAQRRARKQRSEERKRREIAEEHAWWMRMEADYHRYGRRGAGWTVNSSNGSDSSTRYPATQSSACTASRLPQVPRRHRR
ncbi:hypothetical protein BDZ90DRAFT_280129 [Jaminaea rosea]|uniref:Uncharacterized protein n=1 Tax=Jaminaea rosea TaxID=1569628 RepID=A0A316USC1_9BASI|nr:hypothetical protein BDZ90DRAFT_280129 [Jaminaea rosea]PWN27221.1 hypothetical protein BDZ90DRAFT_280129 [Jaminaea rosea]